MMLNDPFDMQFAFQLYVNPEKAIAMALEKSWQHHYGALLDLPLNKLGESIRQLRGVFPKLSREEFNSEIGEAMHETILKTVQGMREFNTTMKEFFKTDKILCLSEKSDDILMWSYYAQNHAGAVLCFTDQTPDNPLSRAQRIRYVEKMPSLFNDEMMSDMLAGYSGMDKRKIMDEVVYSKSKHWAHEAEWRIYSGRGRTSGYYEDIPFNAAELQGVIFGARMRGADRSQLAELLRSFYPHVQLLEAIAMPDAYGLSIVVASENNMTIPTLTKIFLSLRIFIKRIFSILKSRIVRKLSWSVSDRERL
jgi:hypothetical protein